MTGHEKHALMDKGASAVADDAGRQPDIVGLDEVDEGSDVGEQIEHIDDLDRMQVTGETWIHLEVLGAKLSRCAKQGDERESNKQCARLAH